MTVPAMHCEAKKMAYRQSREGLVVSFVIHPNDMPDALAVAPLGQRYMLALAAIGDDEEPVPVAQGIERQPSKPDVAGSNPAGHTSAASQRGKERYKESTPMQQALIRAVRLPADERFRAWVAEEYGTSIVDDETAAGFIRERCCRGESRRMIAEDRDSYNRYFSLETAFKIDVGELAEPR